jgi:cytochrome c biogenesis protein CcmG, thiol:disulfide interchange protein DsbE
MRWRLEDSPRAAALLAAATVVAALAGCGSANPKSAVTASDFKPLRDAPAPLGRLYSQPGRLLDGGPPAFRRQIAELEGHPVVVNKWASWCGPCRFEFPYFQRASLKHGKRVAFLGVDANDANDSAARFLRKLPVPYPSFIDPHSEIAKSFRGERVFPTTAFYDAKGELAFTKQGPYTSVAALDRDIARYAN